MDEKPKRSWFSFSLRTMFVLVTIFGVWLGWQRKFVRERKAVLAELATDDMSSPEFKSDSIRAFYSSSGTFTMKPEI